MPASTESSSSSTSRSKPGCPEARRRPAFGRHGRWLRLLLALIIVAANVMPVASALLKVGPVAPESIDFDTLHIVRALEEFPDHPSGRWWYGRWAHVIMNYYRPVTSDLYWVEWKLFGDHVAGYSAVGIALHIILSLFLGALILELTGSTVAGFFTALAHSLWYAMRFGDGLIGRAVLSWAPQHDVLFGMFYVISLWLLARYVRRGSAWRYGLSLVFFLLAICSKETAYFLPFMAALILWDQRSPRFLRRLLPYFGLAAAMVVFRWFALHGMAGYQTSIRAEGSEWYRFALWLISPVMSAVSRNWWAGATGGLVIAFVFGLSYLPILRGRLLYVVVPALAGLIAGLSQLAKGHWAMATLPSEWGYVWPMVIFVLALYLMGVTRPRDLVLAFGWMIISYVPRLQFPGAHHDYFPMTGWAILDGLAVACVLAAGWRRLCSWVSERYGPKRAGLLVRFSGG